MSETHECMCHTKHTPRSDVEIRKLENRLNRLIGQLNGIKRMLAENRYCGDVLTQVAAAQSALESVGYIILKEHMETCVVEGVREGNTEIMSEAFELMRKLKCPSVEALSQYTEKENKNMKTITIKGMMCKHCEAHAQKALQALDPNAKVTLESNSATISDTVSDDAIRAAIAEAGYEVTAIA